MKLFSKTLILLFLLLLNNNAYSLSNHRIKEICQRNPKRSTCIKNLKLKKLNLLKGNKIEIPVIPFKN